MYTISSGLGLQAPGKVRDVIKVAWPEPKVSATESVAKSDTPLDFALLDTIMAYPERDATLRLLDSATRQDKPLLAAQQRKDAAFEILSIFYSVRDSVPVKHFLSVHPALKKLLFAAFPRIKEIWGLDAKTELQVFSDPEDDSESLVVYILSERQDAYQLLDRFDEEWWLSQAGSSDGLLTFAVR
jgi:hypothetical protein